MEPEQMSSNDRRQRSLTSAYRLRITRKKILFFSLSALIVASLIVVLYAIGHHAGLVPGKIQKSVPFSVYYPENLPSGYTLDTTSFRLAEPGVVLFTVSYGKDKDIVFSEQQQPASSDMDKFVSNYIPLNSDLQLPLGRAKAGAYGNAPSIRTVVSLPIHDGPWLIMTAPSEVNHDDLVKILESLTK